MRKLLILLTLLISSSSSYSLDYIQYQFIFNRMDNDILNLDYKSAIVRLDTIYSNYDFVYAKHCVKALQICVTSNDSSRAALWLEKCFLHGVPMWYISNNKITQRSLSYSNTKKIIQNYNQLRTQYFNTIDTNLEKK